MGSLLGLAAEGCGLRILDTRPLDRRGGAPGGQSALSLHPCSGWCRARGWRLRLDRASPRGRRPLRSHVPRTPGNDRAPLGLPAVAAATAAAAAATAAAAAAAAAAVALEGGRGLPGSASLPAPGRPGQRRRRLLLRLQPAPPRLMPVPGRRSPGATRAPLGACALLPRRGPARSPPTHPGSHRSPIPARARVTPTTAGWRCASTCAPSSRHLRPRGPRAPGPADSLSPEVPPSPPRDGPPAPAELRTRTPAVLDGPAPPARAPRPRRGYCCPRGQGPSPTIPRLPGGRARSAERRRLPRRRRLITIDLLAPPPP